MDGPVHRGDRSDWGFSTRIKSKVITEQSGAYRSITSNMGKEVFATTAALRWLSSTNVTRAIAATDYQSLGCPMGCLIDVILVYWPFVPIQRSIVLQYPNQQHVSNRCFCTTEHDHYSNAEIITRIKLNSFQLFEVSNPRSKLVDKALFIVAIIIEKAAAFI